MSLNVNRKNPDPFYRYKMSPMAIKPEGRGNGKKTVLDNVAEVAEALNRPPGYLTKYLGVEFGAGTQVDKDRHIMKGYFTREELQDSLDNFIRIFVMCQSCDNPETVLSITKQQKVFQKCVACGHGQLIKQQGHKLCTYIINNPPDIVNEYGSKKKEAAQKTKNAPKQPKEKKKKTADDDFNQIPEAVEGEDDDDDWVDDVSEEAVAKRNAAVEAQLGDGLSRLAVGGSMKDIPEEERTERFYNYLAAEKHAGDLDAIITEAQRLMVPAPMGVLFCVESLFKVATLEKDICSDKRKVFMHFMKGADDKTIKHFMGAMEIVLSDKKVTDKTDTVLRLLFEERYVQKDSILTWADKGPSKKWTKKKYSERVHAAAAETIGWLKDQDDLESEEEDLESEEEDIGDDDSDDELDVAFGDEEPAVAASAPTPAESMFGAPTEEDNDNDDFDDSDIDDI